MRSIINFPTQSKDQNFKNKFNKPLKQFFFRFSISSLFHSVLRLTAQLWNYLIVLICLQKYSEFLFSAPKFKLTVHLFTLVITRMNILISTIFLWPSLSVCVLIELYRSLLFHWFFSCRLPNTKNMSWERKFCDKMRALFFIEFLIMIQLFYIEL